MVRTGDDGHVDRARIGWRARCDNGGTYSSRTIFAAPLDSSSATEFDDSGNYRAKPHGYAARIRVSIEGGRVAVNTVRPRSDRKSTRLNSSHVTTSRMPSSA